MFTIENFPEEYFGYKVIDCNENVLFLEYSYSNIYWIKNKLVAVKFSGLDGRRLFIHTVEKDNSEKFSIYWLLRGREQQECSFAVL